MGTSFLSAPRSKAPGHNLGARHVAAAVFVVVAVVAGTLAYFGGYVSPDSSNYLQLAEHTVRTGDFRHSVAWGGGAPELMTVWPLGYPAVLALVTALGPDALTASKLVSIALLGGSLIIVLRLFGTATRPLTPLVFLLPSCVRIHTYSWSEQMFIFGLLMTVLCCQRLRTDQRWWPALATAMSLVFCTRYIGVFLPFAVFGVAVVWRTLPKRRWFLAAAAAAIVFDALYLFNNLSVTGHLTGTERIPAPEELAVLVAGFVRSISLDAAPYILVLFAVAVSAWRGGRSWFEDQLRRRPDAVMCIAVGVAYLGALFALRCVRHFDFFNPRLTFPGVAVGLVGLVQLAPVLPSAIRRLTVGATVLYLGVWTTSHARALDMSTSAHEKAEVVGRRYADLPAGTILVAPDAGNGHLKYPQRLVRPDLVIVEPKYAPYFVPEPAADFSRRLASVQRAHPGSVCVLDLSGVENLAEYRAALLRRGVLPDTIEWLTRNARPGGLVPLEGCGTHASEAAAPQPPPSPADSRSARLQGTDLPGDASPRVRRPDSQIARIADH